MYPYINVGDTAISVYYFIVLIAVLTGLFIAIKEVKRKKLDISYLPGGFFWAVLFGILGNRVLNIIFYSWGHFLKDPVGVFISQGGWMYYGIEIFGMTAVAVYVYKNKLPLLSIMDMLALIFMMSHAIGRVACFMGGCCYGIPTDSFLGVHFPGHASYVYPTELFETTGLFLLFAYFWPKRKTIKQDGIIFCAYVISYGILRFSLEFIRADAYPLGPLHISPSQHIALAFITLGSVILFYIYRKRKLFPAQN